MVQPPSTEEEAVRNLVRCRQDIVENQKRAQHRLSKFLLRQAIQYPGSTRTQGYQTWLRTLKFPLKADQLVFDEYRLELEHISERRAAIDRALEEIASTEPYRDSVGWLRCFQGINTITAMTIIAELHDFRRFENPRQLFAYLGLVPSEHSSGETVSKGGITKTGNAHVRRILVEAAWHYRHAPGESSRLRKRREGQPQWVIAHAKKAHRRLNRRYRRLTERGKPANKAIVAVARALVGFVWAILHPGSRESLTT